MKINCQPLKTITSISNGIQSRIMIIILCILPSTDFKRSSACIVFIIGLFGYSVVIRGWCKALVQTLIKFPNLFFPFGRFIFFFPWLYRFIICFIFTWDVCHKSSMFCWNVRLIPYSCSLTTPLYINYVASTLGTTVLLY